MFRSDQRNIMCSNTYIDIYFIFFYFMCGEKPTKTFMLQTFLLFLQEYKSEIKNGLNI